MALQLSMIKFSMLCEQILRTKIRNAGTVYKFGLTYFSVEKMKLFRW